MYYQSYEDYMRSVLGYPTENRDTYQMNYLGDTQKCVMPYQDTKELENYYPEIYKIINPIVCEICDRCNKPVTREMLDNMVEEVRREIQINNEIAIKVNIDNRLEQKEMENKPNTIKPSSTIRTSTFNETARKTPEVENRQIRDNNPFLNDLIRILILNRLFGQGFFPGRPPFPRPPMRPPFPGGPRPPRRDMEDYNNYLEF